MSCCSKRVTGLWRDDALGEPRRGRDWEVAGWEGLKEVSFPEHSEGSCRTVEVGPQRVREGQWCTRERRWRPPRGLP